MSSSSSARRCRCALIAACAISSVLAFASEATAAPTLVTTIGSATETAEVDVFAATSARVVYFAYVHDTKNGRGVFASTDGTAAGAANLTSPAPNIRNCLGCDTGVVSHAGWVYYFRRTYLPGGDYAVALRRTNGTDPGTTLLGSVTQPNDEAPGLVALGPTLYFVPSGPAFYQVDDVANAIKLVHDLEDPAMLRDAVSCNGKIFLAMSGGGALSGAKLWVSDGTTAGTKSIYENASDAKFLSCVGSRLYFAGGDYKPRWTDGVTISAPFDDALVDSKFWKAPSGNTVLFLTRAASGDDLKKTDGTTQGTGLVRNFYLAYPFGAVGDSVLLTVNDGATAPQTIWRSDGTVSGTEMLADGSSMKLVAHGNAAYFYTDVYARGRELWSTDGTKAGTKMAAELHYATKGGDLPLATADADHPISLGGEIYYVAKDAALGTGIWKLGLASSSSPPGSDGGPSSPKGSPGPGSPSVHDGGGDEGSDGDPSGAAGAPDENGTSAAAEGCSVRASASLASGETSALFVAVLAGALRRRRRSGSTLALGIGTRRAPALSAGRTRRR